MLPVSVLPTARRDQLDQAEYYDSHGGAALGDKFLDCCQAAFDRLSAFPDIGTKVRYRHPRLAGCRFTMVPGFDQILIFYRITGHVEIVRILHGARDIEAAFEGAHDVQH